jgi:hypothetical protein
MWTSTLGIENYPWFALALQWQTIPQTLFREHIATWRMLPDF